jgi:hypothetical protein
MTRVLSFLQFINEADLSVPDKQPLALNYADETMEGLRRHLLDTYSDKCDTKEGKEIVNKCISTYVYALDKKLKIDGDIVDLLAKTINCSPEEMAKDLDKETRGYYDKSPNIIG